MNLIETTVRSKIDDKIALKLLLEMGGDILVDLVDKMNSKSSGCDRLVKALNGAVRTRIHKGKREANNWTDNIHSLSKDEIETCVIGFGKRFPCEHAWVIATNEASSLIPYFEEHDYAINQNSYLPASCRAMTYSAFGKVFLEVRSIGNRDIVNRSVKVNGAWRYLHISLTKSETRSIQEKLNSIFDSIQSASLRLDNSVKEKNPSHSKHSNSARVSLSTKFKEWAKACGYKWNKLLSQPRYTVCDKVTNRGNILRMSADSGGFADLIPYIEAQFITEGFISPKYRVVYPSVVTTTGMLETILQNHNSDIVSFEDNIVPIYESVFSSWKNLQNDVFLNNDVRAIVSTR